MRKRNSSVLTQVLLATVLGIGVTACSSPEQQDAEVGEEPAVSADAQDDMQADAIGNDTQQAPEVDDDIEMSDDDQVEDDDIDDDMDDDADVDDDVEADESESIDADEPVEALDDDEIADSTGEEEHLSTY
ncbi:hypothetical protein [Psychrobacter sp. FDAARGOS_221]|uniref:hypothetical protein n=1 Tax=Psychrobacter sp. FDAARGOS_221 TaxID=1975705 RepID=UPI000BB53DD6|nr:hypothetical protein [Psychrobacter sp. FDAARGOS_221]PNK61084.1 hypothetical protein A6J60_009495 [Psychrobacter sp. FDAARGOS_221]